MPVDPRTAFAQMVDNRQPGSLVNRLRRRRFQRFLDLIRPLPRPVRVLDVGGTQGFWEMMGCTDPALVAVRILNIDASEARCSLPNFSAELGDGCDLAHFREREFDVVFSNSVIEHLYTWSNQVRMAAEIRRVGRAYFVQTPNRYFPMDPHYQWWPFLQLMPCPLQRALATWPLDEVRLLTGRELAALFPDARIVRERIGPLVKSFMAIKGAGPGDESSNGRAVRANPHPSPPPIQP